MKLALWSASINSIGLLLVLRVRFCMVEGIYRLCLLCPFLVVFANISHTPLYRANKLRHGVLVIFHPRGETTVNPQFLASGIFLKISSVPYQIQSIIGKEELRKVLHRYSIGQIVIRPRVIHLIGTAHLNAK